jgi:hypothetical protein
MAFAQPNPENRLQQPAAMASARTNSRQAMAFAQPNPENRLKQPAAMASARTNSRQAMSSAQPNPENRLQQPAAMASARTNSRRQARPAMVSAPSNQGGPIRTDLRNSRPQIKGFLRRRQPGVIASVQSNQGGPGQLNRPQIKGFLRRRKQQSIGGNLINKKYVNIKNYGKRLIRLSKNNKEYIIINNKRKYNFHKYVI